MIKMKCSTSECPTKDFCIAPPNTKTSIAYTDNLDLGYALKAPVGPTLPALGSGLTRRLKEFEGLSTPIYLGLATLDNMSTDDYLVVYCDSGTRIMYRSITSEKNKPCPKNPPILT